MFTVHNCRLASRTPPTARRQVGCLIIRNTTTNRPCSSHPLLDMVLRVLTHNMGMPMASRRLILARSLLPRL